MDNDDNHNDHGDIHDDDYVMTDLKMSAMLTLTNKYNHSDCPGRIQKNDWERFEAARSAAEESSICGRIVAYIPAYTLGFRHAGGPL